MLSLYRDKLHIIALLLPAVLFAANDAKETSDRPIKIETKTKSDSEEISAQTYTPMDNSDRFKVDPKEVSSIKNMDIKALQEKIESIKSKVLDSKSKLVEITKDKMDKEDPVSYLSIQHVDDMSSRFDIVRLTYMLDGKNVYTGYDLYKNKKSKYPVFNSFVAPGHHEIVAEVVYAGSSEGLFDYLKDYRIRVQKRYAFIIPDAKKMIINSIGYEKGRMFTPFKERPNINFEQKMINSIEEKVEK